MQIEKRLCLWGRVVTPAHLKLPAARARFLEPMRNGVVPRLMHINDTWIYDSLDAIASHEAGVVLATFVESSPSVGPTGHAPRRNFRHALTTVSSEGGPLCRVPSYEPVLTIAEIIHAPSPAG